MNKNEEKEEFQRYGYIGYSQDFPLDKKKYTLHADLLLKLARDAVRKHDYYNAIRFLNMVLIKNPKNYTAIFYKKQVMLVLEQMKRSRKQEQTN